MLIVSNVTGTYNQNYKVTETFQCGGTIIDRFTILTAAHCIITSFPYYGYNFNSTNPFDIIKYTVNVTDPFDVTKYTVYVGLQYDSFLDTGIPPSYPAVAMSVQNIIRVC